MGISDTREYHTAWRTKNRVKYRNYQLKHTQGITEIEYQAMLQGQNHQCAICGKAAGTEKDGNGGTRRLAIDHCHLTGFVRGLLCVKCNSVLGYFKDNPELLRKAILYLDTNRARIIQLIESISK